MTKNEAIKVFELINDNYPKYKIVNECFKNAIIIELAEVFSDVPIADVIKGFEIYKLNNPTGFPPIASQIARNIEILNVSNNLLSDE